MKPRYTRCAENGFTLLELLVSITLLAFLSLALVAGLRGGTRIWNKSENASLDAGAMRATQEWFVSHLSRLYPQYIVTGPSDASVAFHGSAKRIEFLSTVNGGTLRVTVEAIPKAGGFALQAWMTPDLQVASSAAQNLSLLPQARDIEFAYFGNAGEDKTPGWHDSWQHEEKLPLLIRIRVSMQHPNKAWPELIVRPKIAADVTCSFDPVTGFCAGRS